MLRENTKPLELSAADCYALISALETQLGQLRQMLSDKRRHQGLDTAGCRVIEQMIARREALERRLRQSVY